MMQTVANIIFVLSLIAIFVLLCYYFYINYIHKNWLKVIFEAKDLSPLKQNENEKYKEFRLKLSRAGITQKQFSELVLMAIVAGLALLSLMFIIEFSPLMKLLVVLISVIIALFSPFLYLEEQVKARIKRIDNDLAIFIDLLIIILEGGGGLNNAIDEVTTKATKVIGKDLLEESKLFKNELITYGSEVAYTNLVKRTGSQEIATIVGYMKLSEETGIGVKTIFENQSNEIKSAELLNIEKKAATMNISITLSMFIFILPAIIAMIVFPMAADALMPKF